MNLGLNPSCFNQHQVNENGKCVNCIGWRLLLWYRTKFSFLLSNVNKMYDVWKRDSERKSWEVRGKLQKNLKYLRPLPASSAPANTDAVIPPTFIWNCLSVCRSWTNSVLLKKKLPPFKHSTKVCTVFTDATKNVSEIQDRELSFLFLCRIFFHWEQNDKVQGQKTKSSNIRTCKSLRLNGLWELQGH